MNQYWIDLDTPFFRACNEEAVRLYNSKTEYYHRGPEDDRLFATVDQLTDYPNLLELGNMFNGLHSEPYTFAFFTSTVPWLPHIDCHGRGDNTPDAKCAANILFPVLNCDEASTTKWVRPMTEPWFDSIRDAWRIEEPYDILYENHTTKPGMINTAIPHGVWRTDDRLRVVGVFAINSTDHVSWEELCDVLRPHLHAA